jgi:hypothetical protein
MITIPELATDALSKFLSEYMQKRFAATEAAIVDLVPSFARIAIECIATSDALYHNVEHTMLVTLAGHDILRGRALHRHTTADDYAHIIIACLTHDIGYVRYILLEDGEDGFVIDADKRKVTVPRGASDASLTFHHVNRSKLFVLDRIKDIDLLDADRIARAIEATRFPVADVTDDDEEGSLLRAADLIGQLGDPHYIRKANALYHEFEEVGINRQLGYTTPADLIDKYPAFYFNMVSPHIQQALRYLSITSSGRQWIANLYANVFRSANRLHHYGPAL